MKKNGLYKRLRRVSVLPVLFLGIITMCFCFYRFTDTLYEEAGVDMQNIAGCVLNAYDCTFEGNYYLSKRADETYDLYKGDSCITSDYSIVDKHKEITGAEISLLYKDMRVHTTFVTPANLRFVGVYANAETAQEVLEKGDSAFYKNVPVLGEKYLVLYVPVRNTDGSIAGMLEVARNVKELKADVWKAVWPIILLIALGTAMAVTYSYKHTKEITSVINRLQSFMNRVAGGSLFVELDPNLLKNEDELGDLAKSAVSMHKSIRGFVGTDPLTGLNNRRYVSEALNRIKERAMDTGTPFAVAITDIDFFKKVNDTYGHNAGDEVLKSIASILKKGMVGKGFASRWGGEEFVLVFDKTDMNDSLPTLEKMLDTIRANIVHADGYDIQVTMTMGIVDGSQTDIEKMVEGADAKLYYGKQHGRNRIVSVIPEDSEA